MLKSKQVIPSMLAAISELTVQITDDVDQRYRILNLAKSITLIINGHDNAPVDASEVLERQCAIIGHFQRT